MHTVVSRIRKISVLVGIVVSMSASTRNLCLRQRSRGGLQPRQQQQQRICIECCAAWVIVYATIHVQMHMHTRICPYTYMHMCICASGKHSHFRRCMRTYISRVHAAAWYTCTRATYLQTDRRTGGHTDRVTHYRMVQYELVFAHIHIYISIHIYLYMFHTHIHVYTNVHTHLFAICICMHTHTYVNTDRNTHVGTCVRT